MAGETCKFNDALEVCGKGSVCTNTKFAEVAFFLEAVKLVDGVVMKVVLAGPYHNSPLFGLSFALHSS